MNIIQSRIDNSKQAYDNNSPEYGRQFFYSEVEAIAINKRNKRAQTEEKKSKLSTRRSLDDFKLSRDLGITLSELNHNRMVG